MSKELKALERIEHALCRGIQSINTLPLLLSDCDNLKKYLTPPTADEVCEALSEYFGFNYYYQDKFFYKSNGIKYIYPLKVSGFTEIQLYDGHLPPHLITLIGRFYEAQQ